MVTLKLFRKRRGVQNSMGNIVPWETGMLIYLPATSRPLISLQKEAVLSPCNFATSHLTAFILDFYLPLTSRPMKRRPFRNAPTIEKWISRCRIENWRFQSPMKCSIEFVFISFRATLWLQKKNKSRDWHFRSRMKISDQEWEFQTRSVSLGGPF